MEKYTTSSEKDKIENKEKKVISDDAFAIADLINDLKNKIEHLRISLK